MNLRLRAAGALLAVLLSSCGGGGGGGGDGGGGGFSVSYDRDRIGWDFQAGDSVSPAVVQATGHGTPSGNVYVGATTPSGNPDPAIDHVEVVIQGTNATVTVYPATGLPAGTYTGSVLLLVCVDPGCSRHYAGSPQALQYTIIVRPAVRVNPPGMSLDGSAQVAQTASFEVTLPPGVSGFTVTTSDPAVVVDQQTATGFRITLPPRAVGTYDTTVHVQAGAVDRGITVHQVVGLSRLVLGASTLDLSAVSGNTATGSVPVLTLPTGQTGYDTQVPGNTPWLTVTERAADRLRLQVASLPSGTYHSQLQVTSGTDVRTLDVRYTVAPPPGGDRLLALAENQATLSVAEGGLSAVKTIAVTSPSWNPATTQQVSYPEGSAQGWLQVSRTPGSDLQLQANALGLRKGSYRATLKVASAFPVTEATVNVSLQVGDGLATPPPQLVVLDSESTPASLKGSIPVVANGLGAGHWAAASSASWLKLTTASGPLGSSQITYTIDPDDPQAQAGYADLQANVTFSAQADDAPGGTPGLTPVTVPVTLRRELAEVAYAGPGTLVAGRAASVIVRGRGFDHLANPAARLSVAGVTAGAVSRLGASSLKVELPALAAGDYPISVSNALGVTTAAATLHVRAARAYGAGALASAGESTGVLEDPLRGQVFSANRTLGAIQRYREGAGGWTKDTLAVAGLSEIALSPDAATLVASTVGGTVHLVDPVGLTVTASYTAPGRINTAPSTGHGLAVTNDGKVWLSVGDGGWSDMVSFDLRSKAFAKQQFGALVTSFYGGGPWFEVSRNGEQLIAVQTAGLSPAPPLLTMSASVGEWKPNPIGLTFFYWPQNGLDATGARQMVSNTVYDGAFALVGRKAVPAGYFETSSVLSPDGRRAYVLAVGNSWPNAGVPPRLFVFDSSVAAGTVADLPLLGQVDLADDPTCGGTSDTDNCLHPMMNVSADGGTLFFAGRARFVVLPIPSGLASTQAARGRETAMKLWIGR